MKEQILKRIKKLEEDIAVLAEVANYNPCRAIKKRLEDAKKTLSLNLEIYKQLTGCTYMVTLDFKNRVEKNFTVKKGPAFKDGQISRELYINGILYRKMITLTEAKNIMESLV